MAVAVVAVAYPLFLHYTGFEPARDFAGLTYPRLKGYLLRQTPGQRPNHGVDFSQIHLSARHLRADQPVYFKVLRKQWRRRWSSTYHPLVHWLYLPTARMPFPVALAVHNLAGIALVLLCAALALWRGGALDALPSVGGVVLVAMFLTPTGLLHLERGQMDLFVAASFVCTVAMFERRIVAWALAAALFSTLKVSAWAFVGFYWLVAAPLWGLRDWRVWLVPGAILLVNLVFLSEVREWLPAFLYVAENRSKAGPSFTKILPKLVAYSLPFVSVFAVAATAFLSLQLRGRLSETASRRDLLERISFPFAAVLGIQTVCATPVTHDYRLVGLLGLLPVLAIWCGRGESIPGWLRYAVSLGYSLLLVAAFRIPPFLEIGYENVAWLLLAGSGVFLAAVIYLALPPARGLAERARPSLEGT